jgi:hypothetical protein
MESLPSGLPDLVADDEDAVRFLTQSNQFNAQMVKPSAFLPNPKDRETSVFRQEARPQDPLWALAREVITGRAVHGAASFKARVPRRTGQLDVVAAEPPPRHAAIRNWPWFDNDPEEQKARQKALAIVIASEATLSFPPVN